MHAGQIFNFSWYLLEKKKKRTVRTARNGNGLGSDRVFAYPDPTAGQDPRPGPGPIINQVFSQGLDPTRRASFSRLGPNLAQPFFLSPLRYFADSSPLKPYMAANSSPLRFFSIKIFGICATLYGNQINSNHRLIISQ